MSADKLASFRVDSQLWEQFQSYAKENNVTATALLISYIKSVVNTGNVITLNQVVNTSSEVNNPSLSIQDIEKIIDEKINSSIQAMDNIPNQSIQNIDKRIDDKINTAIQDINTPSIQNIEDLIDARIGGSIRDGDIKYAIATSYTAMMGQFNGLLGELQELKKQIDCNSIPPVPVPSPPANEELTTDNGELVIDNYQLPEQETGNRELGTGEHEDVDLIDSDLKSDTQSPMTFDKNQIDYVQRQLKKNGIKKTAAQIREAFIDLDFDGTNYNQLREQVIEVLSHE